MAAVVQPEADPETRGSSLPLPSGRRRWHRFAATSRVEYEHKGQRGVSFLANISVGGMFLRSAHELAAGSTVRFYVYLDGLKAPLAVDGLVVERPGTLRSGTPVSFVPNQAHAQAVLRQYILDHVVPRLAQAAARPRATVAALVDLAALYFEIGRVEDALAVYERAFDLHPRSRELHEQYACTFLATAIDLGAQGRPSLLDIEAVVQRGLRLGGSPALESFAATIAGLSEKARRDAEEAERREHEELIARRVAAELEDRLREIDARHRRELGEAQGRVEEAERRLADERRSAARAAAVLEEERRELALERERCTEARRLMQAEDSRLATHVAWEVAAQKAELEARHQHELLELRQSAAAERHAAERMKAEVLEEQRLIAEERHEIELSQRELTRCVHLQRELNEAEGKLKELKLRLDDQEEALQGDAARLEERFARLVSVREEQRQELVALEHLLQEQRAESAALEAERQAIEELRVESKQRRAELAAAVASRAERDQALDLRERALVEREQVLQARGLELDARNEKLEGEGGRLAREREEREEQAQRSHERHAALADREAELERREADVETREVAAAQAQERALGLARRAEEREQEIAARERAHEERDATLDETAQRLRALEQAAVARARELDERETGLRPRQEVLDAADREIARREAELNARAVAVAEGEQGLAEREAVLQDELGRSATAAAEARAARERVHATLELQERLAEMSARLEAREVAIGDEDERIARLADEGRRRAADLEASSRALERQGAEIALERERLAAQIEGLEISAQALRKQEEALAERLFTLDRREGEIRERTEAFDAEQRARTEASRAAMALEIEELNDMRQQIESERATLEAERAAFEEARQAGGAAGPVPR